MKMVSIPDNEEHWDALIESLIKEMEEEIKEKDKNNEN